MPIRTPFRAKGLIGTILRAVIHHDDNVRLRTITFNAGERIQGCAFTRADRHHNSGEIS
jgi:hypothetical protein